jgi:16S rRNA C967 or C1407 C5-methylase (RsmB/RsmF family)
VVQEALNEHEDRFELIDPMPEWERETVEGYEFASKCLRAHPKTNLTNGFFIALFQAK